MQKDTIFDRYKGSKENPRRIKQINIQNLGEAGLDQITAQMALTSRGDIYHNQKKSNKFSSTELWNQPPQCTYYIYYFKYL